MKIARFFPCWFICCLLIVIVPVSATQKTGSRPGKTNPYKSPNLWTLFADDEAGFFIEKIQKSPNNSNITTEQSLSSYYLSKSGEAALNSKQETAFSAFDRHQREREEDSLSMASGRLVPGYDHLVRAYQQSDRSCIDVLSRDTSSGQGFAIARQLETPLKGDDYGYNMIDVTVGDFVYGTDENDNFHDEIVVVRSFKKDGHYYIEIFLYDYQLNLIARKEQLFENPNSNGDDPKPFGLHVHKGDFNGDGKLEFAVIYISNFYDYNLSAFYWDSDSSQILSGSELKSSFRSGNIESYECSMSSGDFNGDGKDDLAVVYAGNVFIFSTEDSLNFALKSNYSLKLGMSSYHRIIRSGLVDYDPSLGFDMRRRQIVVLSLQDDHQRYRLDLFSVASDYTIEQLSYFISDSFSTSSTSSDVEVECIDMAVGNFHVEEGNEPKPTMEILISYILREELSSDNQTKYTPKVELFAHNSTEHVLKKIDSLTLNSSTYHRNTTTYHATLAAFDQDGDAAYLGAPTHAVIEDMLSLDVIMQEPPKHVDYLPIDPENWEGEWKMINVNAYPDFVVSFEDENEQAVKTEDTSTSSWSIGGSLAVSGEKSWKFNHWVFKGAVTAGFETKVEYQYDSEEEKWESNYKTFTRSIELKTNDDDVLYGQIQLLDIWRYPILNKTDENGRNVFLDILLPGPLEKFAGVGLRNDFYQPTHINRNLLSYPSITTSFPEDLGEFELPDGTVKRETMSENLSIDYTGNAVTTRLNWTESAGEGKSKETKHTLSESSDIFVAYKGKLGIGDIEETESKLRVDISIDNENCWSSSTLSEKEFSSSQGVTIETIDLPKPDGHWMYTYKPAVYMAEGSGALKAAHAVNFDTLGSSWKRYYGGRPDLSLALPDRFYFQKDTTTLYGNWILQESNERMAMRGFFVYKSKANEESGVKELYPGSSIVEGDSVDLAARVYNFSLSKDTGSFKVRFECVAIDSETDTEIQEKRTLIGETVMDNLKPREMKEARVTWNTSNMALQTPNAYRIYVIVDPDNQVPNEIHEWKDETRKGVKEWTDEEGRLLHGNNEGYYPPSGGYSITQKNDEATGFPPVDEGMESIEKPLQISFHSDSLAIRTGQGLLADGDIRIPLGSNYRLRAHFYCDGDAHEANRYVIFRNQNSDSTDAVISVNTVRNLFPNTYVWTTWTPQEAGDYKLWASCLEDSDDPNIGDAADSLQVTVYDPNGTGLDEWMMH